MSRLYLIGGRYGDIMGVLPMCWADAQEGRRSQIMVAKEFASILDGCSYVDPVIYPGNFMEIEKAVELADTKTDDLRVCQLAGPRNEVLKQAYERVGLYEGMPQAPSYVAEMWRLAGRIQDWREQHPLVFDRRNPEREKALIDRVIPKGRKKVILVAADGNSSPFQHKSLLLEMLRLKFGRNCDIVDLASVKAERIYDLLGLYTHPRTKCLVAIDSAPLHLAQAVPELAVVAIAQDKPSLFHGSPWRANHIFYCRYSEFPNSVSRMLDAISRIGKPGCWNGVVTGRLRLVHTWSQYEVSDDNRDRHTTAVKSWGAEYAKPADPQWISTPIEIGMDGRDSMSVFKDIVRFPYVKDVVGMACFRAQPDDVIVLTRCDTAFVAGISEQLKMVDNEHPVYERRPNTPYIEMFAFTKQWWREVQEMYPDMIMGRDQHWNRCLGLLFDLKGATELKGCITREPGKRVQIPPNSYWGYNESLLKEFLDKHDLNFNQPKVSHQVNTTIINSKSLFHGGYNPSILRHEGKLMMAYRWHSKSTPATEIALATLDDKFNVTYNQKVDINWAGSIDDPRLFDVDGSLFMSWVESYYPKSLECVVKSAELFYQNGKWSLGPVTHLDYNGNDFTGMQKNWLHFQADGRFFILHHSSPEHVVLELGNGEAVIEHKLPGLSWPHGDIRGGAIVPYKGKLLRFFHSRMENELPPTPWRYYVGCCIIEPKPPFKVLEMSRSPLMKGSELDDLLPSERERAFHRKENVVFPAGAVVDGDDVLLSVGINDAQCGIVRLTEKDLKLSPFDEIAEVSETLGGWCTVAKAHALSGAVLALRPKMVVEIGVWMGGSLIPMAMAMKQCGTGKVWAIDPWEAEESKKGQEGAHLDSWSVQVHHNNAYTEFMDKVKKNQLEDVVVVHKKKSDDVEPPDEIDILSVDGNHGPQAIVDAEKWGCRVRIGGLVFFDDVNPPWPGGATIEACNRLLKMGFVRLYSIDTSDCFQRITK